MSSPLDKEVRTLHDFDKHYSFVKGWAHQTVGGCCGAAIIVVKPNGRWGWKDVTEHPNYAGPSWDYHDIRTGHDLAEMPKKDRDMWCMSNGPESAWSKTRCLKDHRLMYFGVGLTSKEVLEGIFSDDLRAQFKPVGHDFIDEKEGQFCVVWLEDKDGASQEPEAVFDAEEDEE